MLLAGVCCEHASIRTALLSGDAVAAGGVCLCVLGAFAYADDAAPGRELAERSYAGIAKTAARTSTP